MMLYSVLIRVLEAVKELSGLALLGPPVCVLLFLVGAAEAQSLVVTPSSLSFSQVVDLAAPLAQTVQVTASDGSHIPFTVHLPEGVSGNIAIGLSADAMSSVTPATIAVVASGGIALSSPEAFNEGWPAVNSAVMTFVPTPPSQASVGSLECVLWLTRPPPPVVSSVVNAITQVPGVAPGELVTIAGQYLASLDTANMECPRVGPPCHYPARVWNTKILFNGSAAAFGGYSNRGSMSVIVPYGLTGPSVQMVVQHFWQSTTVSLPLSEASPAICDVYRPFTFTFDSTKWCCPPFFHAPCSPGMFINGDYSVNGPANPAPIGSPVLFVANGSGNWNHGVLLGGILFGGEVPAAPVSVTIGGQPAQVRYATSGLADGAAVSYNLQVSAIVPPGIAAGPQPVVLTVGSASNSPQQVTVEVENPAPPKIGGVVNAASFQAPLSPGEYVSIFGEALAAPPAAQVLGGVGIPPDSTTVTFNGAYSPRLYTDVVQINVIAPYEGAGRSNGSGGVAYFRQSTPFSVAVAERSPAIFTRDGPGSGQVALLSVDNTPNS